MPARPTDSIDAGRDAAVDPREEAGKGDSSAAKDAGVGALELLSTSPLALAPSFQPTTHDYYLSCAAGTNTLRVSATAAPGGTVALLEPTAVSDAGAAATSGASLDATVELTENEALVVGVTTEGATEQYWVRCLPSDFPGLELTLHPEAGTPTAGYYLIGPVLRTVGLGYAIMMDSHGVPVWYDTAQGGLAAVDVDNLIPGVISYVPYVEFTFGAVTTSFELHDLVHGTVSFVASSGIPLDLHELQVLPNGDYLVIANPITVGVDLTGLMDFGANENMVECDIQEVTPSGTSVWQWNAIDHFDPVEDSILPVTGIADGMPFVDPFHCNSIDVDAAGDLLVSSRSMNSVFLVTRATGTVAWKMGGSTYTKDGAPYIAVQDDPLTSFYGQHDARFLSDGTLSMFDDQEATPGPARAVIYSYDVTAGTASVVWQYEGTAPSTGMGSFRITADGSRVIGWGVSDALNRSFTEVDEDGHDLLDFTFSAGDTTYRAIKIPVTAFDIATLRATAGGR
jgi:hypothetical protein